MTNHLDNAPAGTRNPRRYRLAVACLLSACCGLACGCSSMAAPGTAGIRRDKRPGPSPLQLNATARFSTECSGPPTLIELELALTNCGPEPLVMRETHLPWSPYRDWNGSHAKVHYVGLRNGHPAVFELLSLMPWDIGPPADWSRTVELAPGDSISGTAVLADVTDLEADCASQWSPGRRYDIVGLYRAPYRLSSTGQDAETTLALPHLTLEQAGQSKPTAPQDGSRPIAG